MYLVGQAGFEPTAPTTPRWCATKLRYCPELTKPILSLLLIPVNSHYVVFFTTPNNFIVTVRRCEIQGME
jgi:hypothetical protein